MTTLSILLLTALATANGFLLTYLAIEQASLLARVCGGAVVGLAALAWVGFLAALIGGMNAITMAVTVVISAAGAFALCVIVPRERIKAEWAEWRAASFDRWSLAYYAAWTIFLGWLFSRVVTLDANGMRTAPANNYGDLPFHLSVISSFAFGENFPPHNPIYAGPNFTYPFLIDFLTAFFLRLGADWPAAFFIENIALALALVGLIEWLTLKLTKNQLAARIAPLLFLFNGGFGFINFFRDLSTVVPGKWWDFFSQLPRTYTINDEPLSLFGVALPLRWGNVFTTLLIPQRSLLFGLPMVAMIVTLWWMAVREMKGQSEGETERGSEGEKERQGEAASLPSIPPSLPLSLSLSPRLRYLLAAGVLAGMLPMLHAHGFFSIMLASGAMALLFWSRDWLAFFLPALALSAPQALWLSGTPTRSKLFELHWGWEAGEASVLGFWLANAGAFLLLLLLALLTRKFVEARARRFYLPFVLCFIVPNVMLLAPWAWDNIKVLIYWYLISCPLVAAVVAYLLSRKMIMWRLIGAASLVVLTLSGALDVARGLSPVENVQLFSRAELEVAELIRQRTAPRALILRAPIHNPVVALTGRPSLMGYPGHLWTHGIDYQARENEVKAIYRGGPIASQLLAQHHVNYVIIGPVEQEQLQPDESFFDQYPVVIDHAGYKVYQVK